MPLAQYAAFLSITVFRRRQPPRDVGVWREYGVCPVLVWYRPEVDTILINRHGPQMQLLTPLYP